MHLEEKKIWMSNYPCSVVHGGSDPVGNQFQISEFHILFTSKPHTVRWEWEAHTVQVCQSFVFSECTITQSDVILPPCNSRQSKMSRPNQTQLLMVHYRDVGEVEILTSSEKQHIKGFQKAFSDAFKMSFRNSWPLCAVTSAIND